MRIDLHSHSTRSDGTDTPTELIENAERAGLDVVALTDHDAMTGWPEAQAAADRCGLRLVRGVEISTRFAGQSVHLLGYELDPEHRGLTAELRRVRAGRDARLPRVLAKLAELGMPLTETEVHRHAGDAAASGRPHIADAMVAAGYVADRDEAFADYLGQEGPAYVDHYAIDLAEAIGLVVAAGGRAVVAHPWSRGSAEVLTAQAFERLAEAGLAGIEVDHNDHDRRARAELRQIAEDLDLAVTGSSDYHGAGKTGYDLGCNLTDPEQFFRLFAEP